MNGLFGGLDPVHNEQRDLPMADVRPDPNQPRKHFDPGELSDLARSLQENGLIQAIAVRPDDEQPGKFVIISGERRYRAAQELDWTTIRAVVLINSNPAVVALVENMQRADLTPLEQAIGVAQLIEEQDLGQGEVAKLIGVSRPTINQLLTLNTLPQAIKDEASSLAVSKSILIELAQIQDHELQASLWQRARNHDISVAAIKKARKDKVTAVDATPASGAVRRPTPAQRALKTLDRGLQGLHEQALTEDDRHAVLDLINKLNALISEAPAPNDAG